MTRARRDDARSLPPSEMDALHQLLAARTQLRDGDSSLQLPLDGMEGTLAETCSEIVTANRHADPATTR